MMITTSIRGGFIPAALLVLVAGCAGGGSTTPASTPGRLPADKSSAVSFERFRASIEAQARRNAPAGYEVVVGSTYVTKDRKRVFSSSAVALKTADTIGFRSGRKAFVFRSSELDEVPGTSIETRPRGRSASAINNICLQSPDSCPAPPDPTDPPDPSVDPATAYLSVSTDAASAISAQRQLPCTQRFTTNGYAGASMSYFVASGTNTWQLQYRPGYPFYIGIDQQHKVASVSLVDGTIQQIIIDFNAPTGNAIQTWMEYPGAITMVKYAQIGVIDYAVDSINQIVGDANVTCANDSRLTIGFNYPVPPHPL